MQEALVAAASKVLATLSSGRSVPRENLHLTLAFVGSVPHSSLPALQEIARAASGAGTRVEVSFDAIEYWRRSEILCAAANHAPGEAGAFAEALKQALVRGSFAPDLKPFRAHVTLARQVKHGPGERTLAQVTWRFSDFALVESRSSPGGSLYSPLASWPLYSV